MEDTGGNHPVKRDSAGRFLTSGNPEGKPKGAKNKITLLKLAGEAAVRERNLERMQEVADLIVSQALNGCEKSQKMVWDSIMSRSTVQEDKQAGSKQTIEIGVMNVDQPKAKGDTIDVETIEVIEHE